LAFGNPATKLTSTKYSIALFTNNQYLLKDLTSVGAYMRGKIKGGQISGGLHYLGNKNHQESRFNIGYALQVEKQLWLGFATNIWHFSYREKQANQTLITFTPCLSYQLNGLRFGALVKNLGMNKNSPQWLQESIAIGVGFKKQNIQLLTEIEKYTNRQLLPRIAILYQLHEDFSIQYGITLRRFNQHIGIAFTSNTIRYELAFYHQNVVGNSSAISVMYSE
jgi:hypothetical protein